LCRRGLLGARPGLEDVERRRRLLAHHDPDRSEQDDVEHRDGGIDLAGVLEQPEHAAADQRSDEAAGDDHRSHPVVDPLAAAVGEHARDAGAGDLGGRRGDRDGRRDSVEDQDRSGQEAAADPDHSGQQADARRRGEIDIHE
jgi:hypothetical protein